MKNGGLPSASRSTERWHAPPMKLVAVARLTAAVAALLVSCDWRSLNPPGAPERSMPQSAPPSEDRALSAQEVAEIGFKGTALVVTRDGRGQPLSLGSGFFVDSGLVVTNGHVIEGAASGTIRLVGQDEEVPIVGVAAEEAAYDLAILAVEASQGAPLRLSAGPARIGDAVYAVGNPRGLEGTFSAGIVSGVRRVGSDSLYQITAPISPGSSGGPVLDASGRVLGVATATISGGQNLNLAVPSAYVRDVLSSNGSPRGLSEGSSGGRDSFVRQVGTRPVEGVGAAEFLWGELNTFARDGGFSFSLTNELDVPIRDVVGAVIFYSDGGVPLDYTTFEANQTIPPKLAVRAHARVDVSTKILTTGEEAFRFRPRPRTRVEFRILSFSFPD